MTVTPEPDPRSMATVATSTTNDDATLPDPATRWPARRATWRLVQVAVWAIGLAILVLLFVAPTIGLHAFWDVLIPVAPALLVIAPGGAWRSWISGR